MNHFCGRAHSRERRNSRVAKGVAAATGPTHEEIARLAYAYWEAGGHLHGSSLDNWLRAERELRDRAASELYW